MQILPQRPVITFFPSCFLNHIFQCSLNLFKAESWSFLKQDSGCTKKEFFPAFCEFTWCLPLMLQVLHPHFSSWQYCETNATVPPQTQAAPEDRSGAEGHTASELQGLGIKWVFWFLNCNFWFRWYSHRQSFAGQVQGCGTWANGMPACECGSFCVELHPRVTHVIWKHWLLKSMTHHDCIIDGDCSSPSTLVCRGWDGEQTWGLRTNLPKYLLQVIYRLWKDDQILCYIYISNRNTQLNIMFW